MSPQAHARVDEKHFEIVGPTFSNTVGEFRKLFLASVLIALTLRKVSCIFFLTNVLLISNYRSCFWRFFWKLLQWRQAKIPQRVVCKLVLTILSCACAPDDICPQGKNNEHYHFPLPSRWDASTSGGYPQQFVPVTNIFENVALLVGIFRSKISYIVCRSAMRKG